MPSVRYEVKVGMHQGSGLSPLLFVIVMEAISREFRVALPWELLYADDLAVIAETEDHHHQFHVADEGRRVVIIIIIIKGIYIAQVRKGHKCAMSSWSLHHHVRGRQHVSRDLQLDVWNRFVAGRPTCSVDDQVGDAMYGQEVG